jgi:UDP-galactopyranose mutase
VKVHIIGCGLSGITAAIILKQNGCNVEIFETRSHIGGNCYDNKIGDVFFHNYGPHIFHTNDEQVFSFLSCYTEWTPFKLKPKGNTKLGIISLPYSRKTVAEIGRELSQEEIIEYIFKEYSEKQWGIEFNQIPSEITNRVPKTKECLDPTWFEGQKYQCVPKLGYAYLFENMLQGITVNLNCNKNDWKKYQADLTVYTGKIDEYFNFIYGALPYRSLQFVNQITKERMKTFIINQNSKNVDFMRQYDHSYFSTNHSGLTVITKEYSIAHNFSNIPFYPIPFGKGLQTYKKYKKFAEQEKGVIFVGRLATYNYLDMWQAVKQAMNLGDLCRK